MTDGKLSNWERILEEISLTPPADEENCGELLDLVRSSESVMTFGAGRVGLASMGFTKRLMHLGKHSYYLNDVALPRLSEQDLVIVASGSGETSISVQVGNLARATGVKLAAITNNRESSLGLMADLVVVPFPEPQLSVQPMTTLFEQKLGLFFDKLVLDYVQKFGINMASMEERHNAIE